MTVFSDQIALQSRLATTVAMLAEGIVVQDIDGRIVFCNPAAERILERPASVLLGLESRDPTWRAIHEDGSEWPGETHPAMETLRTGRAKSNCIMGLRFENGEIRWISINTQPIFNPDATVESVICSFSDVSLLREQMQRLDLTVSAAGIGTWDWNIVTGEVVFNEAWAKMLGYELDEIEPNVRAWERLVDRTASKQIMGALEEHLTGRTAFYRSEHRVRHKNGSWVWIIDTGRVVHRDLEGKPLRAMGMHVDITALKEMEVQLRASQAKFEAIFDQTFQFIGVLSTSGILLEANRTGLDLIQAQAYEVVGKPFWETPWWNHSVTEQSKLKDAIAKAAQGEFVRFETSHVAEDGTSRHVDFSIKPARDELGQIVALIPEGRDISEVVRVRDSLRASQDRFTNATQCANVGVWDWNPQTDEAWFNDQWYKMLGYEPGEFPACGATWLSLLHPDDTQRAIESLQRHIREIGSEYRVELRMRNKSGQWHWILTVGRIVHRDAEQKPIRFSGVHIDITEQKKIEQQLAQSQRMEAIGQLAAGIAHEINTPMQFISDNLEFLSTCVEAFQSVLGAYQDVVRTQSSEGSATRARLDQLLAETRFERRSSQATEAIADAMEGCKRVIAIVRAMRQMSRSASDELHVGDLNEIIQNATILSRNTWKMVADMELNLDPNLPRIWCDAAELSQVFINLVNNACDAIMERKIASPTYSGRIVVSTSRGEADTINVQVADNGMGIKPNDKPKVFDLFFTTKPVGKGTGQGLAITHEIITKKHKGSIRVESDYRLGAIFQIHLPIDPRLAN